MSRDPKQAIANAATLIYGAKAMLRGLRGDVPPNLSHWIARILRELEQPHRSIRQLLDEVGHGAEAPSRDTKHNEET